MWRTGYLVNSEGRSWAQSIFLLKDAYQSEIPSHHALLLAVHAYLIQIRERIVREGHSYIYVTHKQCFSGAIKFKLRSDSQIF